MYPPFVRPGIIEHITNLSIHVTVICTPRKVYTFIHHVYAQELLHPYYRVKVVAPFVGNEECISCWFSGVATSRVPEPSPMTVADHIFAR